MTLGAAALSLLCGVAMTTQASAQDRTDHIIKHEERHVMVHHTKRVCTMRHHHRVCVVKHW
jgi:hypothetical protein